ncbi:phosphoenolpyruvate carboxylase [Timonella sp. A28]|uniref:phosphoenolpyruvate carboxylase n=1 Tax=Timonella sp. A28 TaxID=3442640 RepID=UPI003EB9F066
MSTPKNAQAADVAGRREAEQEMPAVMRADVNLLGTLLGQVLRETNSPGLFEDVERLRLATIDAYTDPTTEAFERAVAVVESFSTKRANEVARAFTCYFHLVNLAEEHHRVRSLRFRDEEANFPKKRGAVAEAFANLSNEIGEDKALERLQALRFHPVFTAHPTEARRRAVSTAIRRISVLLDDIEAVSSGGTEHTRITNKLIEEIDTLWRTAPLRSEKPTPEAEVRAVMAVFDDTLFTAVPNMYSRINNTIQGETSGRVKPVVTPFLRLGSWVGGDRDGNPFVTAKVTRTAASIASEHVLIGLERVALRVGRSLTVDGETTPPTDEVQALWARLRNADEDAALDIVKRSPMEPHRHVMLLIARRISATKKRNADLAYTTPELLLADLRTVQESLIAGGAHRQAYGQLQHLIWQVETYGFHLTELECRQHSAVHRKVLAELESGEPLSEQAEEVLEVFRTISFIQERYGLQAAGRYIVSFTTSAQDLANVYTLARAAVGQHGTLPVLDVVPLFETFDDLQAAPEVMNEVLSEPQYAARLEETGRKVEVMLGYSDSSKDVGPVAATLALYEAQEKIATWAQNNNIELTLFHGRGGALGRGGGPANSAVLAQPPHSVDGRFKLTEQGEVIFARYGNSEIAIRHVDQVAGAILQASAPSNEERNSAAAQKFASVAQTMAQSSREHFYSLVKADGFAPWFATVTPMEEIGLLALGSRPARRGLSVESLEDLRAIPWVFAWSQARINLAGWFGLGTALETVGDLDLLQEAYREWPLFRTMIDNVAMSLAKTDDRIAHNYLSLGDRADLSGLVLDEMALTRAWVVRIVGGEELLANKPVLQRAVKLRSPYVDALSLLQLRALRALRSQDISVETDPEVQRLLLLSVSGVSAGLQNTG